MDSIGWNECQLVTEVANVDYRVAEKLCDLFADGETVPFIARYRRHITGGMEAGEIRLYHRSWIKAKYEAFRFIGLFLLTLITGCLQLRLHRLLRKRCECAIMKMTRDGTLTSDVVYQLNAVRTLEELAAITGTTRTLSKSMAERARSAGLEPAALHLMDYWRSNCDSLPNWAEFIKPKGSGMFTILVTASVVSFNCIRM